MRPDPLRWLAVAAWAIVLVAIAVAVLVPGKSGKLYPTFVAAGEHFWLGQPIYGPVPPGQDQYRYSPLVAATFAPWAFLPTSVGAVLWRWLQAAAFLLALRAWARTGVEGHSSPHAPREEPGLPPANAARATRPRAPHAEREGYYALALLCLPLVIGNVFNAQLNPLVTALLLAGVAALSRERYNLAAAAIAAATVIKVYPLALGLLLCVVEAKRFTPRLFLAVALGGLLPFSLQSEEYVTQQFADWVDRVGEDDRTEQPIQKGYHDFQKLLRRWGMPTTLPAYRGMEVVASGLAAAFVAWGRMRGWGRERLIQTCAALGLVWCTLFGPATESATYMLLAPVAAVAFVAVTGRPLAERVWVRGAYLLLVSVPVALWFPRDVSDPYRALIPQAHAALMLGAWLVWRARRKFGGSVPAEPDARSEGDAGPAGDSHP